MTNTRTRLLGLGATVAILLLSVGTPSALIALGATPWEVDVGELAAALTSPDDGTLALVVIGVVAWLAWLVMAGSLVIEILAHARGVQAQKLPGLGAPQQLAGKLVATAALLFAVAPTVVPAFAPPPAHAAPAALESMAPRLAAMSEQPVVVPDQSLAGAFLPTADVAPATTDYTVRRGDSLWKIAEEHLGDGARYVEIIQLNESVLNGRPDFIFAGTILRIPHEVSHPEPVHTESETRVVEPGDTLSEIALDELGDPMRYREIFEASRHTVQPDGDRLTDPDLIRPGWNLTIPGGAPANDDRIKELEPDPPVEELVTPTEPVEPPAPSTPPTTAPELVDATPEAEPPSADADLESESSAGWLVPGLTGAGAVLAGSLLLAVRAHRRTQQRYRRPGHVIAPPPTELRDVEKTASLTGAPTAAAISQLDRLLRHLVVTNSGLPDADAVELDRRTVTLHFATAADLPEPWHGADKEWCADLDVDVPEADVLAPYPLLVSVGQDDSGHLWLVDLERLGSIALTGGMRANALATHVAAELALNPWSVLVSTDVVGVAAELASLDPVRLHHHAAEDTDFLGTLRRDLEAAQQAGFGDPDPFHVVVTTRQTDDLRAVVEIVKNQSSRTGAAVVTVNAEPEPDNAVLEVTADGRLRVPRLGLDLRASGLTPEEALACAAIVDLTRDATVVPTPSTEATVGWRALADDAGALQAEFTDARPAGPAGTGSLLPDSADGYKAMAATTAEDVAELAPVVPEQTRRTVEETDPNLDHDLTEWRDPDSQLPKLTLLGPVNASARGDYSEIAERKPYFVEMLAYLTTHPEGVSSASVADAFSIGASRARTDLSFLRAWLATNPRTERPHLPAANASRVYEQTGVAGYQVEDVLVDLDLFRRLRARGQARGSEGIADLEAALMLVTGEPFDRLRERGWSWLLDGERLHETAACAVVDTAHIVVADALANGDVATAHTAAEIACHAAPYDDVARLDLVQVAEAEGHEDLAEQMLRSDIFNRTDDYLPPIDLPERTAQVVKNHDWGRPRHPSNQ